MPHQLQLIFDRQAETKQRMKELKVMIADALEKDPKYQEVLTAYNQAKSDLNIVRDQILDGFRNDIEKLDVLKTDALSDRELMTIEALTLFRHDKDIIVKDKKGQEYVAEFSVRFKKK